ncbi:MAG: NAD(P)/FAD-dependent oxidoreductase [Solirubrobacteraceae bacterium]|nr:NAD(P)/FAD-dependent oxidoreductase [Solirubrobacteraceae bacterium]
MHGTDPTPTPGPDGRTLVLGGGPAGLTAGYLLAKRDADVVVYEAGDQVGGIAMTVERDGYRFDLGGHRFFTKVKEVENLWYEIMGDEFLRRPRMSRIFWNGKFLAYPLEGMDVIKKLGPVELTRAGFSYLWAVAKKPFRRKPEATLEEWVSNRFGKRLYQLFFKTYTEKVWGRPCDELSADWAAQRIKGLSFWTAAKEAFFPSKNGDIKTLITEFDYPRYGPGQMWEKMTGAIAERGGEIAMETPIERLRLEGNRITAVTAGGETVTDFDQVISSLPLRNVLRMTDGAPEHVKRAAEGLEYRDFLTVSLVIDGEDLFPDNWIYIHEPGVTVGRIQNFRSWSPWMVPDDSKACVGMEYFCFKGDRLWDSADEDLVALATRELEQIGLAKPGQVEKGYVVRVPKAYPVYDDTYKENVAVIAEWLEGVENLQQVGRNGLHRYNNSDHSMLTAMRAVDNVYGADHDLWAVNADAVYLEEGEEEANPYPYVAGATPAGESSSDDDAAVTTSREVSGRR